MHQQVSEAARPPIGPPTIALGFALPDYAGAPKSLSVRGIPAACIHALLELT
ncbi:hypothetical protein GCM10010872_00040 [Dyella flava]|nr:hypothetical protein GCM10010872_00040 [Dyella flava]